MSTTVNAPDPMNTPVRQDYVRAHEALLHARHKLEIAQRSAPQDVDRLTLAVAEAQALALDFAVKFQRELELKGA